MDQRSGASASGPGLRLHHWLDPPVLGVALVMAAAGFAQFSPAAALADVAEHFGELRDGETLAEQAGLPGTVLGAGLAAIRLSALTALPLAALADRFGRRPTMLTFATVGLGAVVVAAVSPGDWWFVALFALARSLLTATDTIGEVTAAEHTAAADRRQGDRAHVGGLRGRRGGPGRATGGAGPGPRLPGGSRVGAPSGGRVARRVGSFPPPWIIGAREAHMFVVELSFSESQERLAERPAHRERLERLHDDGTVRMAGPFADDSGALLIFDVPDETALDAILAEDPYFETPGVTVVRRRRWMPIVGG